MPLLRARSGHGRQSPDSSWSTFSRHCDGVAQAPGRPRAGQGAVGSGADGGVGGGGDGGGGRLGPHRAVTEHRARHLRVAVAGLVACHPPVSRTARSATPWASTHPICAGQRSMPPAPAVRARAWSLADEHAPDHDIDARRPLVIDVDTAWSRSRRRGARRRHSSAGSVSACCAPSWITGSHRQPTSPFRATAEELNRCSARSCHRAKSSYLRHRHAAGRPAQPGPEVQRQVIKIWAESPAALPLSRLNAGRTKGGTFRDRFTILDAYADCR